MDGSVTQPESEPTAPALIGSEEEAGPGLVGKAGALLAGRLVASALSYVGTLAIARTLSADDWGGYTFALGLTGLVVLVLDFQVSRLVLVELERIKRGDAEPGATASSVLSMFVTLRAAMGFGAGLVAIAITALGDYPADVVEAVALMTGALVLSSAWNGAYVWYQHTLDLGRIALILVVTRFVFLGCVAGLVAAGVKTMPVYILPAIALEAVTLVAVVLQIRHEVRIRPQVDLGRWKRWLREAAPIAIGGAIGLAYTRLDIVMLSMIGDLRATGLYGVAYKFTDIVAYLPGAILGAAFPLLVRTWRRDERTFGHNVRGAMVLLLAAAAGLLGTFAVFSYDIVRLLYGERFASAGAATAFVVGGEGLRFLTAVCVQTLIAVGRNRAYPAIALLGLAVNVGLNFALIPDHSFNGAAWATVATELLVLLLLVPLVARLPGVRLPWGPAGRVAVAFTADVVVGLGVSAVAPWPVAAAAGALAFLGILQLVGLDGPGGLRAVRHLIAEKAPSPAA